MKLGFNGTWSMAVGGMVGGGIFSTLGVVIAIAGAWAWLSFLVAGLIALMSGYAYAKLAAYYGEGGGAFTFLREIHAQGFAGSLSWILIVGYVLTNAVYAYTFGEYLGHVAGLGPWFPRLAAVAIIAIFVLVNLRGAGEAGAIEIFLVWFKLFVLLGLAAFGFAQWQPSMLSHGVPDAGIGAALFGAASVFMAYEGFQLLTYDYEDIDKPDQTLPRAILSAIVMVTITYIAVAIGTAMLIGADKIVLNKEVALAVAGGEVLGNTGLYIVTIAAAFSTGSALNATLFATARLSHLVALGGELPAALDHRNAAGAPDRAVLALGFLAAVLAVTGKLSTLVEAASLSFLFTFAVVCGLAFQQKAGNRFLTGIGALGAASATLTLMIWLAMEDLPALIFLAILALTAVFGRPVILRHFKVKVVSGKNG
jgi:amino acid transporter